MSRNIQVNVVADVSVLERELKKAQTQIQKLQKQMDANGGKAFSRDLDRASKAAEQAGRGALAGSGMFSGLGRSVAFASGAFLGGAGLISVLHSSVEAATKAQTVQAASVTQLKALGIAYQDHAKQIDEVIARTSHLAALDDEDLKTSFTSLVRVTKDVNQALDLTGLAADVARGKNVGLEAATMIVTKAQLGQLGALKRMGVEIPPVTTAVDALKDSHVKATTAQLAAAKAADQAATRQQAVAYLQKTFAGQAEAYGNTAAGAQERFKVATENLRETIGAALLPTVTKIANEVSDWTSKTENLDKVQHGVNTVVEKTTEVVKAVWPEIKKTAGFANDVANAMGGWDNAFKIITGGLLARKVLGLASAFSGKQGLTTSLFRATLDINGKGGLLAALSNINGLVATATVSVVVKKIIDDLTGSGPTGSVAAGAAGGAVAGAKTASKLGKVLGVSKTVGGKVLRGGGGGVGAVVGALADPDTPSGGDLPRWDGSRWTGVGAAGQAYWNAYVKQNGLVPVVGATPYQAVPAPKGIARRSTSGAARPGGAKPFPNPGARDYSNTPSARDRAGGGGSSSKEDTSLADVDPIALKREAEDILAGFKKRFVAPAIAYQTRQRNQRLFDFDVRHVNNQGGPLSGFNADSIAADKARAAQASAAAKAHAQAIAQAVESQRGLFRQAFSQLGDAGVQALEQKYARMQRSLQAALKAQLAEIEKARAELTPAEQELQALTDQHDEQGRQDALQAALASGDEKQIAEARYAIQIGALQKQAAAERAARNQDAAAKAQAAQDDYDRQSQAYNDQLTADKKAFIDKINALSDYLALREKSVSDANTRIRDTFGEFAGGLDAQINDVLAKLANVHAAAKGAPSGYAGSSPITLPTGQTFYYPMADGGDFMVHRPTLFLAGEAGPERATFTPTRKAAGRGGTSTTELHLHFDGATLIGATLDEAAQKLAAPIRRELIRTGKRGFGAGLS